MKRVGLYLGGLLAAAIFLYAALSALVNQGLSIWGALIMLAIILAGGSGLIWAVRR